MPKIVESAVAGKPVKCRISNYHGDVPSLKLMDFCEDVVLKALFRKFRDSKGKSTSLYFEKDGKYYKIYMGLNRTATIPGKYTYNVYECR